MAVFAHWLRVENVGPVNAGNLSAIANPGIGGVLTRETLAADVASVRESNANEIVVVANGEAAPIFVAFGADPDPSASSDTADSSAGYWVGAGQTSDPLIMNEGDKVAYTPVA